MNHTTELVGNFIGSGYIHNILENIPVEMRLKFELINKTQVISLFMS